MSGIPCCDLHGTELKPSPWHTGAYRCPQCKVEEEQRRAEIERARVGWGFWLSWVLASTGGWIVGVGVVPLVPRSGAMVVDFAVFGAVVGAAVGAIQWRALRWRISRPGWWVLASIVGYAVGNAVGYGVATVRGEAVGWPVLMNYALVGATVGAVVGITQWLVLRRQVSRAGWWVPACIVGYAVGLAMGYAVDVATPTIDEVGWPLGKTGLAALWAMFWFIFWAGPGAFLGAILGAVTGVALVRMLRRPLPGTGQPA